MVASRVVVALISLLLTPALSLAQGEDVRLSSRLAIGVKFSLLGAGVEAATPFQRRSNLRAGFNTFRFNRSFHKDGIAYGGQLTFRSVEAHYDWFPFYGSFHVSPGVLVYDGNRFKAGASVPAGRSFTLNRISYVSDPADPVSGSGRVGFRRAGPMISAGWGNLLPRNGTHLSIPFEFGVIYTAAPQASLSLKGSACDGNGLNCRAITSDAGLQNNVQAENDRLNKDMAGFKFYPVISLGFGVSF